MSQKFSFPPPTNKARKNIKVMHLVKLLQDDAEGGITLTNGRRKSIEILLKKCMPDLSALAVQDSEGNGTPASITINI